MNSIDKASKVTQNPNNIDDQLPEQVQRCPGQLKTVEVIFRKISDHMFIQLLQYAKLSGTTLVPVVSTFKIRVFFHF